MQIVFLLRLQELGSCAEYHNVYLILASQSERIEVGRETPVSEFIVEFDYMCVKHIKKLQKFKHFKYWFGVCIIQAACNYANEFLL